MKKIILLAALIPQLSFCTQTDLIRIDALLFGGHLTQLLQATQELLEGNTTTTELATRFAPFPTIESHPEVIETTNGTTTTRTAQVNLGTVLIEGQSTTTKKYANVVLQKIAVGYNAYKNRERDNFAAMETKKLPNGGFQHSKIITHSVFNVHREPIVETTDTLTITVNPEVAVVTE